MLDISSLTEPLSGQVSYMSVPCMWQSVTAVMRGPDASVDVACLLSGGLVTTALAVARRAVSSRACCAHCMERNVITGTIKACAVQSSGKI